MAQVKGSKALPQQLANGGVGLPQVGLKKCSRGWCFASSAPLNRSPTNAARPRASSTEPGVWPGSTRTLLLTRSPILQRVNQYYVATYLGVQPQSLSRIRRRITLAS